MKLKSGNGPGRHAPAQGRLTIAHDRPAGDISDDRITMEVAVVPVDRPIVMANDDLAMIATVSNVHAPTLAGKGGGRAAGQKGESNDGSADFHDQLLNLGVSA